MTRDDIIKWAREAGWTSYDSQDERFERFAKLVYEKAWADAALAATHTITDAAILKEREACAKIVEKYAGAWSDTGYAITQTIRERGTQ